jgi:hypothetical protein
MSETHDRLLRAALSDRDRRPWNYYRLDHDTMKRVANEQADKIERLEQALAEAQRDAYRACAAEARRRAEWLNERYPHPFVESVEANRTDGALQALKAIADWCDQQADQPPSEG